MEKARKRGMKREGGGTEEVEGGSLSLGWEETGEKQGPEWTYERGLYRAVFVWTGRVVWKRALGEMQGGKAAAGER